MAVIVFIMIIQISKIMFDCVCFVALHCVAIIVSISRVEEY